MPAVITSADVAVLHGTAWFHFRWLVPTNFNSNMINHLLRRRKQCNNNNNRKQCNNYPTNPPSHAHTHFMAPNAKRSFLRLCSILTEWVNACEDLRKMSWEISESGYQWGASERSITDNQLQLMIISGGILYTINNVQKYKMLIYQVKSSVVFVFL